MRVRVRKITKNSSFFMLITAIIIVCIVAVSRWKFESTHLLQIPTKELTLALIEQHLRSTEMQITDIRPGLEKSIKWAGQAREKTEFSIVYVHGFTASKAELRPVPDMIAARLDANLFFTRLSGHARTAEAMQDASVVNWMHDLAEAFEVGTTIGEKVIVISCSTGGTIVANGIANSMFSEKLFSAVFFSPNFGLQEKAASLLTFPLARYWAPIIAGEMQINTPRNEQHARYWTTTYPTVSLIPMMELINLAKREGVRNGIVPALFYFSPDDKVVDPQETEKFMQRWQGPKQIVRINGVDSEDDLNHLITGAAISPSQVARAVDAVLKWHYHTTRQKKS